MTSDDSNARVAIVGGGPAGLMAAEVIAAGGAQVTVYDAKPSLARKFLMAGRGGLNLTHSEELDLFLQRYSGGGGERLRAVISEFPPSALRAWCEALGQETFVGSSGRVFPKAMKASPLLRAWLRRLDAAGVRVALRHRWTGWDDQGRLQFETDQGSVTVSANATVLALGGASWPRLGSDGGWVDLLSRAGIEITPLQASNCGCLVAWTDVVRDRFEGTPLKRVELTCGSARARGEAVITQTGLEGGGIYALSGPLREEIAGNGEATLHVNLRPDMTLKDLEDRLSRPRNKQSFSTFLRKAAQLSPAAIGLVQEAVIASAASVNMLSAGELARLIKAVPVRVTGLAPIDKAISTSGGVSWDGLDAHLMLRSRPGTFVAGEMLDWDAPTGGYLLQACFATGVAAGRGTLQWLATLRKGTKAQDGAALKPSSDL